MSKTEQIAWKMQTAQCLRWRDPELAATFARSAVEDAQALGVVSSSLHFQLADILDDLGNHAQAFREATEALRLDPFHPDATMLANALAWRLRAALRSALRAVDDPAIPRLYALLAQRGETTFACHVTMIRYLLATGQTPRALGLAEAVAELYSDEPQAWSMLAEAARAAGNEPRAEEAQAQIGLLTLVPGFRAPVWQKV